MDAEFTQQVHKVCPYGPIPSPPITPSLGLLTKSPNFWQERTHLPESCEPMKNMAPARRNTAAMIGCAPTDYMIRTAHARPKAWSDMVCAGRQHPGIDDPVDSSVSDVRVSMDELVPPPPRNRATNWIMYPQIFVAVKAVKELKLSYHNPETILFTTYPYHGNFN